MQGVFGTTGIIRTVPLVLHPTFFKDFPIDPDGIGQQIGVRSGFGGIHPIIPITLGKVNSDLHDLIQVVERLRSCVKGTQEQKKGEKKFHQCCFFKLVLNAKPRFYGIRCLLRCSSAQNRPLPANPPLLKSACCIPEAPEHPGYSKALPKRRFHQNRPKC